MTTKYKYARVVETLRDDPRNGHEAGTQFIELGKNSDPDYTVLTEDGPVHITHKEVEQVEAPHRMTKDQFIEYLQNEVFVEDTENDSGTEGEK